MELYLFFSTSERAEAVVVVITVGSIAQNFRIVALFLDQDLSGN